MGLLDGIFGFGSNSSRSTDLTPEEFRGLRSPLAGQLSQLFSVDGVPGSGLPGAAGMTDAERSILSQITTGAGQTGRGFAGSDVLDASIRGDFLGGNPFGDAAVDAVTRDVNRAFDDRDLENRALFTRAGHQIQESSPFSQAQAETNSARADAVADVSSQFRFAEAENERNRQIEAVRQREEIAQLVESGELQRQIQQLEAAALPRLIEQLGIDAGRAEFDRRLEVMLSALGIGAGLADVSTGQTSSGFSFQAGGFGGGGGD